MDDSFLLCWQNLSPQMSYTDHTKSSGGPSVPGPMVRSQHTLLLNHTT